MALLLDKGVPRHARQKYGWTALRTAADGGQAGALVKLLNAGANVDAQDNPIGNPIGNLIGNSGPIGNTLGNSIKTQIRFSQYPFRRYFDLFEDVYEKGLVPY